MNPETTATILAHTCARDQELVTLQLEYPRIIHAQFLTYGLIRRNTSSSRAIPVDRTLTILEETGPYIPDILLKNKSGMGGGTPLSDEDAQKARAIMLEVYQACRKGAEALRDLKLHKQDANRYLDYFTMVRVVATASRKSWSHFLAQRDKGVDQVQPAIAVLARTVREALEASVPRQGTWHVPWVSHGQAPAWSPTEDDLLMSVGYAARTSYLREDVTDDFKARLGWFWTHGHSTPFDHAARMVRRSPGQQRVVTPYAVAETIFSAPDEDFTYGLEMGWAPLSTLLRVIKRDSFTEGIQAVCNDTTDGWPGLL